MEGTRREARKRTHASRERDTQIRTDAHISVNRGHWGHVHVCIHTNTSRIHAHTRLFVHVHAQPAWGIYTLICHIIILICHIIILHTHAQPAWGIYTCVYTRIADVSCVMCTRTRKQGHIPTHTDTYRHIPTHTDTYSPLPPHHTKRHNHKHTQIPTLARRHV